MEKYISIPIICYVPYDKVGGSISEAIHQVEMTLENDDFIAVCASDIEGSTFSVKIPEELPDNITEAFPMYNGN